MPIQSKVKQYTRERLIGELGNNRTSILYIGIAMYVYN